VVAISKRGQKSSKRAGDAFQVPWLTIRQPDWTQYPVRQCKAHHGLSIQQDRVLTHSGALGAYWETGDSFCFL
jgi:hypothetical protein